MQIKRIVETQKMYCYEVKLDNDKTCVISSNKEMEEAEIKDKVNSVQAGVQYGGSYTLLAEEETEKLKNVILNNMNADNTSRMVVEVETVEKEAGFTEEGAFVSKV